MKTAEFNKLKESLEEVKDLKDIKKVEVFDHEPYKLKWYDWIDIYWSRYIKDSYYWIRNFIFHRYDLIRTGLPKGRWSDKVSLMLYGNMNMLVDFVDKEDCFGIIEWEADPEHSQAAKEIKAIYSWWKSYPGKQEAISHKLDEWAEMRNRPGEDWLTSINREQTPEQKEVFEMLHKMEEVLYEEEQDYLARLMKIRPFLWT